MKKHIICLQGQGDVDIVLCTPEQFEWIESDPQKPGKSSWTEIDPTFNVEAELTIGSYDNDRALAIVAPSDGRKVMSFTSPGAATKYAAKQGWEIAEEEYHGCIY